MASIESYDDEICADSANFRARLSFPFWRSGFLLLLFHLGSCEVGKAPSKRLGENAFGVLLPYIDIGNERVTDGGTDSDHEREKTGHRVWYDNPLNMVDGLDRR